MPNNSEIIINHSTNNFNYLKTVKVEKRSDTNYVFSYGDEDHLFRYIFSGSSMGDLMMKIIAHIQEIERQKEFYKKQLLYIKNSIPKDL